MRPDFTAAIEISRALLHAFYVARDMEKIIDRLGEHASWFGAGYGQMLMSTGEIVDYFRRQSSERLPFQIVREEYRLAAASSDSCIVTCQLHFTSPQDLPPASHTHLRFSFCYQYAGGAFRIAHAHASMPGDKPLPETLLLPLRGRGNRAPLQLDVHRMQQVVQTLLDTLPVGLKSMEVLPGYPCAYINRNLLKFLDYDYDGFLAATQASALAFICESDRARYCEDLRVCFARGNEYSTQYRAVKRDGSLLQILEWGQKIDNFSGGSIINAVMAPLFYTEEARPDHAAPKPPAPTSDSIPIHLFLDTALEMLNDATDLPNAICGILELTAQTLRAGRACLALLEAPKAEAVPFWQWSAPGLAPLTGDAVRALASQFDADGLCVSSDLATAPQPPLRALAQRFSASAALCSLLYRKNQKIGVLCICDTESARPWQSNEIDLAQSCAKLLVRPAVQAQRFTAAKDAPQRP